MPNSTTDTSIENRESLETALQAITERNQQNSPFLRLTGEIRNIIYYHSLGGCEIYAMSSGSKVVCMARPASQFAWSLEPITKIMALHLPLVCRQIRSETGKYFAFISNTFGAVQPDFFSQLVARLTLEQKSHIEVAKMNFAWNRNPFGQQRPYMVTAEPGCSFRVLLELPNLKRLVLRDLSSMNETEKEHLVREFKKLPRFERFEVEIQSIC
jgi:hypothetical protein